MMITNPNTLGLFEQDIAEASEIVHNVGGLMYEDGANFNAILGRTSPGLMGFDAVHYNLHKTFSQPHWRRRPSDLGPIGVKEHSRTLLCPLRLFHVVAQLNQKNIRPLTNIGTHGMFPNIPLVRVQQWAMATQGLLFDAGPITVATVRNFEQCRSTLVLNANYLRHAIHREAKAAGDDHLFVDGADTVVAVSMSSRCHWVLPKNRSASQQWMSPKDCSIWATWPLQSTSHWSFPSV